MGVMQAFLTVWKFTQWDIFYFYIWGFDIFAQLRKAIFVLFTQWTFICCLVALFLYNLSYSRPSCLHSVMKELMDQRPKSWLQLWEGAYVWKNQKTRILTVGSPVLIRKHNSESCVWVTPFVPLQLALLDFLPLFHFFFFSCQLP